MINRNLYFSKNTDRILKSVIPNRFRIQHDKTSNGYKLVNAMFGIEIDIIRNNIDEAKHINSLELFDFGTDYDLSEVIIKDNILGNTLYGDNNEIKVTTIEEFYNGDPTRIDALGYITVSGVEYGIIGLEYLRNDPTGSGILLINMDVDPEEIFLASGYQTVTVQGDELGNFNNIYTSGLNFAITEQSYTVQGFDEVLTPDSENEIRKKYPETRRIKASRDNNSKTTDYYTIDHYEPYNGYMWDSSSSGYIALGYNSDHYYDTYGNKIYYRSYMNNPYGTGNYTSVYLPLRNTPISGTLRLFDIDHIVSGVPIEISYGGRDVYYHSGIYLDSTGDEDIYPIYIGYEPFVPPEFLPLSYPSTVTATHYLKTEWDYVRQYDGLDDKLDWLTYESGNFTNKLKITNPISRYLVTYCYAKSGKNKYITTTNATKYIKVDDGNYIFSVEPKINETELAVNFSRDTNPGRKGIVFNGLDVRPGSTIDRLEITNHTILKDQNLATNNTTISIENNVAGYSNKIYPNAKNTKLPIVDCWFYETNPTVDIVNEYGTIENINYKDYFGKRLTYPSGNMYYSRSGYFDLEVPTASYDLAITETDPDGNYKTNNRYVNLAFRLTRQLDTETTLARSSDGSGLFWSIDMTTDGYFIIKDEYSSFRTKTKVPIDYGYKEIILEKNSEYNMDIAEQEYSFYYKENDSYFKKLDLFRSYATNTIPSGISTDFFINTSVDAYYAKIYEDKI